MNLHRTHLIKLAAVLAVTITPTLKASPFNFHVDLNVASLIGVPNSPFLLDFQLNEGSSTLSNIATLTGFTFTNGSATGSPQGNGSGSLSTSVVLTDSPGTPFVEFYQGFAAGTTDIQFNVSLTQNPGVTPDGFFVSILDSEAGNPQIATNAGDGVSLVSVPIKSVNSLSDVSTASSTSPAGVTATITPVPEPSSVAALIAGLGVLVTVHRRRLRSA